MAYREITDGLGRLWSVWDTYPHSAGRGAVIGEFAGGWLTFETDGEKRRLAPVPVRWDELQDSDLIPILHRAARVERLSGK